MTEIEFLKCKLQDKEKAFDKLYKRHMDLLKKQGELERENGQLRTRLQDVLAELYCKDKKLEDLGISIECCDTDE